MTKGVIVHPILTNEFSSCDQIDLIGMFKWIFMYQDHLTKFVNLQALTSKRVAEVAHHLLHRFLLIGAPLILQSDNDSEFTALEIHELKIDWPAHVMVHGKPRHPQSQGSVECANGDIKDMLFAWMGDNYTVDWSTGIKFVQFHKNSSLHSRIKRSSYAAMFGCDVKVGLTSSFLPTEVTERMLSEDHLLSALASPETQQPSNSVPPEYKPKQRNINESPNSNDIPKVIVNEDNPAINTTAPVFTTSQSDIPPPMSLAPMDSITSRMDRILMEREGARTAQFAQAECMAKRSRLDIVHGHLGDNVAVPIPLVDRGHGDSRNILGVILERNEYNMYKISVKSGILRSMYARNQFYLCPQSFLQESDVDRTKTTTLRGAVTRESTSGGQGYVKCTVLVPNAVKATDVNVSKTRLNVLVVAISVCHVNTSNYGRMEKATSNIQ